MLRRQRHAHAVAELCRDRQRGIRRTTLQFSDVFPADASLTSQPILAQSTALPAVPEADAAAARGCVRRSCEVSGCLERWACRFMRMALHFGSGFSAAYFAVMNL
jgi:hypothetical protein